MSGTGSVEPALSVGRFTIASLLAAAARSREGSTLFTNSIRLSGAASRFRAISMAAPTVGADTSAPPLVFKVHESANRG